jgi:hypothetical protein
MKELNEKHYQTFKFLRFQFLLEDFDWDKWDLIIFAYKADMCEEYYSSMEQLKRRYPKGFEQVYDMFGYPDKVARVFILRFNQEFVYEFGGLTIEQAKNKFKRLNII